MKKFIVIALILFLILLGVVTYLNKVVLPQKIKALIISTVKEQTGKDMTLKSLEFSLFRGLVLRDLVITDNENVILSTRQAIVSIFIWPIFKKQIIIPSIELKSPYIFLERRPDKTFNLQNLFIPSDGQAKKPDFSVSVFRVNVSNGYVVFQDDSLQTKFRKEIKNIRLKLYLGLPASIKFNLRGEIANIPPVFIAVSGQYKILNQELLGNLVVKNLSVKEFRAYYDDLSNLVSGSINLESQFKLKDQLLEADIAAKGDNLVVVKDKLSAKLNSSLKAKANYDSRSQKLKFTGVCDISQADIAGIGFLPEIKNLRGKFIFSQRSLFADNLKAELLGKNFEIRFGIKDFNTQVLSIDTDFDLTSLPDFLKDKFNFSMINSASGKAVLSVKAHPAKTAGFWILQGNLNVSGASLKLDKQNLLLEDISAALGFSQDGLSWENVTFKHQGTDYETSGTLVNFNAPDVKLKFYSPDLSLAADFNLSGKKIQIGQFKGKYLDSQFSVNGNIDNADPARPKADLSGKINLELNNLNKILEKQYPQIKTMKPAGQLDAQFNLSGNLADFKSCYLKAELASSNFSLYGLKTQSLSLDFFQDQKIIKIPAARIGFYDGLIQGAGALNLNTPNSAYQLDLKAAGINLQKLKNDTFSKSKNIAGILSGELKLNGAAADLSKLNGAGSLMIKEGKLWELNLLQGLGKFLFARDLSTIDLSECFCDFLIKDKSVYTDKLQLKGKIANLTGPLKIGFDGSLEGVLDVIILSENVPLNGTLKDLTTAFIGQAGKFGVIKLSGTLQEPKYGFKLAVTSIIKGITDVLFGR